MMLLEKLKALFVKFDNAEVDYKELAEEFCRITDTKIYICFNRYGQMRWDRGTNDYRNIYIVKISRNGKTFSVTFGASIADTLKNQQPTKYDVLACLQKYDVGNFDDFCSEFGYEKFDDENYYINKKSMSIYKAVQHEYNNVVRLFDDVLDFLREIN